MNKGQTILVFESLSDALRKGDRSIFIKSKFQSDEYHQFSSHEINFCESSGLDDFSPVITKYDGVGICHIDERNPSEQIINGEIYVIWFNGKYHIRQLEFIRDPSGRRYLFKSDNPQYADFVIDPSDKTFYFCARILTILKKMYIYNGSQRARCLNFSTMVPNAYH